MLDAGEMPNLAALREGRPGPGGHHHPRANAGGLVHVRHRAEPRRPRDLRLPAPRPKSYLPDLALNRYEQKNAFSPPKAVNSRKGKTIWDRLTRGRHPLHRSSAARACTRPSRSRDASSPGWACPTSAEGWHRHLLHDENRREAAGSRERGHLPARGRRLVRRAPDRPATPRTAPTHTSRFAI